MPGDTLKIFYFSGTGNAKQVAVWFSEAANQKNMDCRIYDIAETKSLTGIVNPEDTVAMISPIHGFNYPKIMLDFIRRFPQGNNRVILMNTRGGLIIGRLVTPGVTGIAFMLSSLILRKKGYRITGQIPFDMPSNWISIHPALRGKPVDFIFEKNHERVKKHFEKLCTKKTDFRARKDIVQDISVSPVAVAYYFAGRYFLAKSFYASSKCTQCNLCVKECPVQAIKTVDRRPYWTFRCESCMKCMNRCPERAIETTHGLWALTVWVSAIVAPVLAGLLPAFVHHWLTTFLIFNLLFACIMVLLYRLQHRLLNNRIAAKIIAFTSLTFYRIWGRYRNKNRKNNG